MVISKASLRVKYSLHILKDKLPLFNKQGFNIPLMQIEKTIKNPEHTDKESDKPKTIVSGEYDERHILRVVYKVEDDIIKAITIYLAEKGRYY